MESGFYRCSNSEISTGDWISLNFNAFQGTIFTLLAEHRTEIFEDLIRIDLGDEPEEPDSVYCTDDSDRPKRDEHDSEEDFSEAIASWQEDYAEYEHYQSAHAKWEEDYAEWEQAQQLMAWPVAWNTMWAAQDNDDLVEALAASGFVVYRTHGELTDFGPIVFGVDGCGYGFYGAHWIPLRARLARCQYDKGYCRGSEFAAVLESLIPRVEEQGDDPKQFLVAFGQGVPEIGFLDCVIGWELHEQLGLDAKVVADAIQEDKEMDEGLHQ